MTADPLAIMFWLVSSFGFAVLVGMWWEGLR